DCPYEQLSDELKDSLNEYYLVPSLENYDEVYRAVAFFCFKYGKVDYIETNNEYWLERDARLRTDFNVNTGFHIEDMEAVKFKSKMKANYIKAGIPVARYHMVDDYEDCAKFIEEVGYPVVAKPDNGVGANDTHKIKNEEDLRHFFATKFDVQYIMEEYIYGEVQTYDSVINAKGEPIFENGNVTVNNLMETVSENKNCCFYERSQLPDYLLDAGRRTVKAFGVKSRFVHMEFFRLDRDQHIGKKGDIVALEVNMRPPGGLAPTMMNYANGTDAYEIWADMIAYGHTDRIKGASRVCCFASRRDGHEFVLSPEEIRERYADHLVEEGRVEEALSGAMANYMFMGLFDTEEEARDFARDVLKETAE
ncbi:MAG: ATP-grasp domain-containing protein, partial [Erysipelotrichaceae bacterium]|nr:ATP-grasp domain-containing protein [Erysipelotrichaceae bacterium]